ncbi:hypothetical protein AX17_002765 [Amanita inopinata Kibby_2008]|nr:hypothetical protein AX17_002765 [Amanita inopinata Kibby_2008]
MASLSYTSLDALRNSGVIVASDGAEFLRIAEFHPQDATTNPSLVYAAVTKAQYSHLLDDVIRYTSKKTQLLIDEQTELAMDRLLVQVAAQILRLIPGRVSVSVDPRLADDYEGILRKSRNLIALFQELSIPRSRALIKIPATYHGILAARTLETSHPLPIHTNMTLVFSPIQALACAQAHVSVVSPFVGRVRDWHAAQDPSPSSPYKDPGDRPLSDHPGIQLIRKIRRIYDKYGYSGKTAVMAAGFRKPEEIVEVGKGGRGRGPDYVTLPPDLLCGLKSLPGHLMQEKEDGEHDCGATSVEDGEEVRYFSDDASEREEGERLFRRDIERERIAADKVPEGCAKFSADVIKLESLVRERLHLASSSTPHSSPSMSIREN